MSNKQENEVYYVLSYEEIGDSDILDGLWTATAEVRSVLSRREFQKKGWEKICASNAAFKNLDGSDYHLPDYDEIFGDDPDFRWLDNCFLAKDWDGNRLRTPSPQTYERIRFIDLFFQIAFPVTISSSYK